MSQEIIIILQALILLLLGIGVKGIIGINVHLARLDGKIHELEMGDRYIEGAVIEIKNNKQRDHQDLWQKIDEIDKRCMVAFKKGNP